jgi:hypothetical protein
MNSRRPGIFLLLLGSVILLGGFHAGPPARAAGKMHDLANKLAMPIDLEKGIDRATPLKDSLEFLSDRYDFTILIDTEAFQAEGLKDPPENFPVQLPRMKGVRLGTVLRLLLDQAKATYLLRSDHLEVVPTARVVRDIYQGRKGPHSPLVYAFLEGKTLSDAIQELTDATSISIVLDPRTDKAFEVVAATLVNVPLDSAVHVLADTVGLKAVHFDNVFYLTTRENARTLEAEEDRRRRAEPVPPKDAKEPVHRSEVKPAAGPPRK